MSEILSRLDGHLGKHSNKLAFRYLKDGEGEAELLTYEGLLTKAKTLAKLLVDQDLRGRNALLVYMPGIDFIIVYVACFYAGVVAIPVYPPILRKLNIDVERLELICRDAKPAIILADSMSAKLLKTAFLADNCKNVIGRFLNRNENKLVLKTTPMIETDKLDLAKVDSPSPVDGEGLAFIQYSSGSTGNPKGVMVTHDNLMDNIEKNRRVLQIKEDSTGVSWLPHYHDMGLIGFILTPLVLGNEMTLFSPISFLQKPIRWLEAISKYKATHSGGPNFGYELCIKHLENKPQDGLDLSHWEVGLCGAEPINPNLPERVFKILNPYGYRRETFFPVYGLAEHTLLASGVRSGVETNIKSFDKERLLGNEVRETLEPNEKVKSIVSCGHPSPEGELAIVDPESLTTLPSDKVGEIWLKGNSVASGYWGKEEETTQVFHAFTRDGNGPYLRTGDLGFLHQGELYIVGRIKDIIIVHGKKHAPQDLEISIQEHVPAIRKGNIAAFPIELKNQEKVAIVAEVAKSYREKNYQEVFNSILQVTSRDFEVAVSEIVLIKPQTIKKTSSGKIQRRACKQALLDNQLNVIASWRSQAMGSK